MALRTRPQVHKVGRLETMTQISKTKKQPPRDLGPKGWLGVRGACPSDATPGAALGNGRSNKAAPRRTSSDHPRIIRTVVFPADAREQPVPCTCHRKDEGRREPSA